jgi:hypothetical protein
MRISGHKLKRARGDRTQDAVANLANSLGCPVSARLLGELENRDTTDLTEWHVTALAATLGVAQSALQAEAPRVIDAMAEDLAEVHRLVDNTGTGISAMAEEVWWIKAQLYRLVQSIGGNLVLPLDAGPELEHYYLHTPGRPRAGCKACVENFGGPEL